VGSFVAWVADSAEFGLIKRPNERLLCFKPGKIYVYLCKHDPHHIEFIFSPTPNQYVTWYIPFIGDSMIMKTAR